MLDSHPGVAAYSELFLDGRGSAPFLERFGPTDAQRFTPWLRARSAHLGFVARARNAKPYLEDFYGGRDEIRAVGFKLMYRQARRNPAVAVFIASHRVHIVHLIRANLLDIVVSQATADTRGQYHAWEGEQIGETQITLEPTVTLTRLRELERQRSVARWFLRLARVPTLELTYERLRADTSLFDKAFEFLGVDGGHAVQSSMRKLNQAPKSELVENWPELRRALSRTRYAEFVEA